MTQIKLGGFKRGADERRPGLRALRAGLLTLVLAGHAALAQPQGQPQSLPATTLQAGMYNIRAEVAESPAERQIGLMHRKTMPTNDGMLFVFERGEQHCFWMKNTLLPLSIAFVADDGSIVNIADMKPLDETSHCPLKPVRYALEMNQGWFAKRGFKAGSRLQGGPFGTR
ncbi:MAG: DUF192 domain-containing protein [Burkholderiales bacterium]